MDKARIERVADEGEWFDAGTRVEYAVISPHRPERRLEKAALGRYEVVQCERLPGDDTRLLAVTLQPFGYR
jgi:hypothetical protein